MFICSTDRAQKVGSLLQARSTRNLNNNYVFVHNEHENMKQNTCNIFNIICLKCPCMEIAWNVHIVTQRGKYSREEYIH